MFTDILLDLFIDNRGPGKLLSLIPNEVLVGLQLICQNYNNK